MLVDVPFNKAERKALRTVPHLAFLNPARHMAYFPIIRI